LVYRSIFRNIMSHNILQKMRYKNSCYKWQKLGLLIRQERGGRTSVRQTQCDHEHQLKPYAGLMGSTLGDFWVIYGNMCLRKS
jgi:hypothetical protein